jgi:glycosyltransferase involved in cell wall biosynthesis
MTARVSVIVPFYNQAAFVAETVESVLAQDHHDLQVVLADDASTDDTLEQLGAFASDPRVVILSAPSNRGIAGNLNAAMEVADGEYVALLGGDDVMLPGKIAAQLRTLQAHPEAVACAHDAEVFQSASGRVLGRFSELYNGRAGVRSGGVELQFDPTYFMLPSATMFRRSAAPAHGYDTRLRFANDWLWTVELLRNGSIVAMQDVLVRYRRHAGNITADASTLSRTLEEGLIALAIVEARYPELARLAGRRAGGFELAAARQALAARRWGEAGQRVRMAVARAGPVGTLAVGAALVRTRARRGDTPG